MLDTAQTSDQDSEFSPGDATKFGTDLVHYQHNLSSSGLFTDAALADLIENYPRQYYMITTMTEAGEQQIWRNGDFNGASGKYVLEAIRTGRLWLSLRRLDIVAPEYDELIDNAFDDIEQQNPKLRTSRRKSSILISSPGANVLYHADIPMVALWHIRGRKRVWIYDADNKVHLPDEILESVVLRETEEEIPYDAAWDVDAKAVDLDPGWAVSWPQNAPHRVDNLDGLNVSVTTDYFTPAAQRKYGVYFANGIMRRKLGHTPRSTNWNGFDAYAKCAAALAAKKAGLHRQSEGQLLRSFILDRTKPGQIISLPKQDWRPIIQA